ncbi:MAG: hypothetical protein ACOYKR_13030, partial [Sphingobacterium thalpophilum]
LSIAGRYLLRQGLFNPELFFIGMGSTLIGPNSMLNKPLFYLFCNKNLMIKSNFCKKVGQNTRRREPDPALLKKRKTSVET